MSQQGGEVTLKYYLTGTPKAGELRADFSRLGLTATQSTQVEKGMATIEDKIISFWSFDTRQGRIRSTSIPIPYTNPNGGTYEGVDMTIPLTGGENGDANNVRLTIPAGTFNGSSISAQITVDGHGIFNVKKEQGGVKTDVLTFPVTLGGTSFNIIYRSNSGYISEKEASATRSYTKNDCAPGYSSTPVDYTKTAMGRGVSLVSQADADQKAIADAQAKAQALVNNTVEGQAYANANGVCTSPGRANIADYTVPPIVSFGAVQGELRDGMVINIPYTSGFTEPMRQ